MGSRWRGQGAGVQQAPTHCGRRPLAPALQQHGPHRAPHGAPAPPTCAAEDERELQQQGAGAAAQRPHHLGVGHVAGGQRAQREGLD